MSRRPSGDIYVETLAAFDREAEPREPLTTREVADALGANRRTVYKRLRKLVENGHLETKEVGARGRVWWRPVGDSSASSADAQEADGRLDGILERSSDYAVVIDAAGTIAYATPSIAHVMGYDPDEVVGTPVFEFVHRDHVGDARDALAATVETPDDEITRELRARHADGSWRWLEFKARNLLDDPAIDGILVDVRDVTERKEDERRLRETTRQLQGVLDTIESAIFMKDRDGRYLLMNRRCREILDVDDDRDVEELTSRDLFPEETAERYRADDRRVLETEETITVERETPTRNGSRTHLAVKSPVLDERGDPYAVCGVSTDITGRKERECELESQREQLAALHGLNEVFREITDAVIEESSHEAIERATCERLAASNSYEAAWIADVDPDSGTIAPRYESGVEGTVEETELPTASIRRDSRDPVSTTYRTGEVSVCRSPFEDFLSDPVRDVGDAAEIRSFAAVPVVYDETLYGVVGVYSERPDAFAEEERTVIGQLGEVVGHAIAAVEQKKALLNDKVVELAFQVPDFLDRFDLEVDTEGTIAFDRRVDLGDRRFLVYGTATDGAVEALKALIEAGSASHWVSMDVLDTSGDATCFEARLREPTVLSTVADCGGYVHEARITDGDFYVEIHLVPSTDISRVTDVIKETFPAAELLTRRQTMRTVPSPQRIRRILSDSLTERQQAALEAGYFAGFFEWPRDSSGEEVAASLGIGASTFHQHVRKAEKKVLDVVFDEF